MVLDLSFALPWNWINGTPSDRDRRKLKKKAVRTRAEQLGLAADAAGSSKDAYYEDEGYYPGIVNISGTYCFMDSTLQAMASLTYLQPHIDEIHARAEALDVPTPVVDTLRDILHELNTPRSSPRALRPVALIEALAAHSKGKHNSLFSSREHQDAQELFQLVSEAIKSEAVAVHKEGLRDRGLGALAYAREQSECSGPADRDGIVKGVFDGLTANRRSCVQCGYTEAVMHFGFDNWQLPVPRQAVCRLEECLADYTRLEVLTDCVCRKCSMVATAARLDADAERLSASSSTSGSAQRDASSPSSSGPSSSKRKRAREARRLAGKIRQAIEEGRVEEDIKGVKMEKVVSGPSTKQAMIARPPPVLALHLNRSMHYGHYATKNTCRVHFPEVLDLTPFTTSGQLSTSPSAPLSAAYRQSAQRERVLYRLAAVVCHYGQHSFGHYVCFRRKPRPPSAGARRWAPPRMVCPLGCACAACERFGPIREEEEDQDEEEGGGWGSGRGWLRVSDDSVRECGVESVLSEGSGAFMLYYERVVWDLAQSRERDRGQGRSVSVSRSPDEAEAEAKERDLEVFGSLREDAVVLRERVWMGALGNGVGAGVSVGVGEGSSEETLKPPTVRHVPVDAPANGEAATAGGGAADVSMEPLDASPGARSGAGDSAQSPVAAGDVPKRQTIGARIVRSVSARARARVRVRTEPGPAPDAEAGSAHTQVKVLLPNGGDAHQANGDAHHHAQHHHHHQHQHQDRADPLGASSDPQPRSPPPSAETEKRGLSPPFSPAKAKAKKAKVAKESEKEKEQEQEARAPHTRSHSHTTHQMPTPTLVAEAEPAAQPPPQQHALIPQTMYAAAA